MGSTVSIMTARDELAELLANHESMGCGCCAYGPTTPEQSKAADALEVSDYMVVLADAILAAGYRKPRTVTTVEELDALPDAVLVLTEQGGYWESIKRMDGRNWWHEPGNTNVSPSEDLTLPATVLHEGAQS